MKIAHDREPHYLEPWVEQPASKLPPRKEVVSRPMDIPKANASHLKRCQASAGDLSGAAEDVQEALGSWNDVVDDHSPTTVLGAPQPKNSKAGRSESQRKANVWESVFNPGRNYNMEGRVGASQLDKDGDGFITAKELRAALGKDAAVSALIQEADKNGDGKIDVQEFNDLLRHS